MKIVYSCIYCMYCIYIYIYQESCNTVSQGLKYSNVTIYCFYWKIKIWRLWWISKRWLIGKVYLKHLCTFQKIPGKMTQLNQSLLLTSWFLLLIWKQSIWFGNSSVFAPGKDAWSHLILAAFLENFTLQCGCQAKEDSEVVPVQKVLTVKLHTCVTVFPFNQWMVFRFWYLVMLRQTFTLWRLGNSNISYTDNCTIIISAKKTVFANVEWRQASGQRLHFYNIYLFVVFKRTFFWMGKRVYTYSHTWKFNHI